MTTPGKQRIASHRISAGLLSSAVALALFASVGVAPAYSAKVKQCGTTTHGQNREFAIKARGVTCITARKMTKQWNINVLRPPTRNSHRVVVRGFTCLAPSSKIDRLIDCRRPGARVTWHQGALLGSCVYTLSCKSSEAIDDKALRV